jgi:hypothetical protein
MARSADTTVVKSIVWCATALALGVASAGALANGVATLPLLAAMAVMLRQSPLRAGVFVLAAIAVGSAYFVGYGTPGNHGAVVDTLMRRPLAATGFSLALLGSPFGIAAGSPTIGSVAGAVVAAIGVAAALRWRRERSPTELALIAFLAYEIASAVGVAGGRLLFGDEYALAGRYTTPALFAWGAALPLALSLSRRLRWVSAVFAAVAIVATAALFVAQLNALSPLARHTRFVRMVAGLALARAVSDRGSLRFRRAGSPSRLGRVRRPAARRPPRFAWTLRRRAGTARVRCDVR